MTAPIDPGPLPRMTKIEYWVPGLGGWIQAPAVEPDVAEALSDGWGGLQIGAETWGRDPRTLVERHYRVVADQEAQERVDSVASGARGEARAEKEEEASKTQRRSKVKINIIRCDICGKEAPLKSEAVAMSDGNMYSDPDAWAHVISGDREQLTVDLCVACQIRAVRVLRGEAKA